MGLKRLHYIDVAKGLLILMVVYGHLYAYAKGFNNVGINYIRQLDNFFVPFYMPCFFVITGYCSNFNKTFLETFFSSFKTIMIPGISLSVLILIAKWNISFVDFICLGKEFLFYGGKYWFLSALFVSRILYWLCNRFDKRKQIIICAISFSIGFVLGVFYHGREYWYFVHALLLMPYLAIGHFLKGVKLAGLQETSIFLCLLLLTIQMSYIGWLHTDSSLLVPGITQKLININSTMFFPLVILSVSGSIWLLRLSIAISSCSVLEYIGRNSLVIYCLHGFVFSIIIPNVVGGGDFSVVEFCARIIVAYVITICLCSLVSYILNQKYLKVLIGKF